MVWATEFDHVDRSAGGRVLAIVPDGEADAPDRNREVLGLLTVALPGLDGTGHHLGEVALAELRELRGIASEVLQYRSPLVDDLSEFGQQDPVNRRVGGHGVAQARPADRARRV